MYSRDELLHAFEEQDTASLGYWRSFETAAFFNRIGESWSPAETVRHLIKSTRPLVKALSMPRVALFFLFGRAKRPSMTYDQLVTRYRQLLSEGGQAGRFAPSPRDEANLDAWRLAIIEDYARVGRELRAMIARWPEARLDRWQLPHPLLGKLTVREMLFFTLYHQRHHVGVVEGRFGTKRQAG